MEHQVTGLLEKSQKVMEQKPDVQFGSWVPNHLNSSLRTHTVHPLSLSMSDLGALTVSNKNRSIGFSLPPQKRLLHIEGSDYTLFVLAS
ncbi:hypothetical protein CEXT_126351 [Caerostris extrusa]|uniref:Uncharacterized protein n=1 Tax=Caerostris extrusa TaxID=172846 RepID=A0AAV4XFS0_CAEEX|nr:hypothetical protein CEXT_126351 [Caerostris extrusa]